MEKLTKADAESARRGAAELRAKLDGMVLEARQKLHKRTIRVLTHGTVPGQVESVFNGAEQLIEKLGVEQASACIAVLASLWLLGESLHVVQSTVDAIDCGEIVVVDGDDGSGSRPADR